MRPVMSEDGTPARGIFVVSALGGAERQIAASQASTYGGLSWSPDGSMLALVHRESATEPDAVFLLHLDTGEKRRLTTGPDGWLGDLGPRFSPDGTTVAFVRFRTLFQGNIYLVPVAGGEPQGLTFDNVGYDGLDWTPDGRDIVFSSNRGGRAGYWSLWRVPASGGEPEALEVGEHGRHPTLSREGSRLAYRQTTGRGDIWRAGGPASAEEERTPTRLISFAGFHNTPHYSPDGREIVFSSQGKQSMELWVSSADGSNPRQLTFLEASITVTGRWSPDGRQIAFASTKDGSYDVYVISAAGGFPRRLTRGESTDLLPTWSRDGRWIYFGSNRTGAYEVYRVSADGGDAAQLTTNGGAQVRESPDRRFLYLSKRLLGMGPRGIWRMPIEGGEESLVHDRGGFQWELLEHGICYLDRAGEMAKLELLDLATGDVRLIADLEKRPSPLGFAVSPDGRWVLYQVIEGDSDVMLVDNFR
jgi:Tol biopolymer transport system component